MVYKTDAAASLLQIVPWQVSAPWKPVYKLEESIDGAPTEIMNMDLL